MKKASGWAARVDRRLTTKEKHAFRLVALADDLAAAITDAYWTHNGKPNLYGPTMHMRTAIACYQEWRNENAR